MQTPRDDVQPGLLLGRRGFGSIFSGSAAVRAVMLIVGLFGALAAAELAVRWYDGGGLPSLRIFVQHGAGPIELMERAAVRHRRSTGEVYPVATGILGLRAATPDEPAPAAGGWITIGDSQVFGLGVGAADTFAAVATARGVPMANAGVPGHGLEDALRRAATIVPRLKPKGILIVVNQANDWSEMGQPIEQRFRVRGGWLLRLEHADRWEGVFMESWLSRSHALFHAAQFVHLATRPAPPALQDDWLTDPSALEAVTRKMVRAIEAFAEAHADLAILVCFLPVDFATGAERAARSPFHAAVKDRRPWERHELRDQLIGSLASRKLDLLPVLRGRPDAFLEQDYHLSPVGHALVADAIARNIASVR